MEANDVLADQVDVGGPIALPQLGLVRIAQPRNIIGQRIEPNIHDMRIAAGHWDAPIKAGARGAEIFKAAFDEARDLITASIGLGEDGASGRMGERSVVDCGHKEAPVY